MIPASPRSKCVALFGKSILEPSVVISSGIWWWSVAFGQIQWTVSLFSCHHHQMLVQMMVITVVVWSRIKLMVGFNIFLSYSFYEFLRRLLQYDNHPMLKQQSTLLFPFGIALVARVERCHQKVILHVMEFPTKHFVSLHMVFEGWNNSPLVFVPLFEMHFHVVYFHNFLFQLSQFNCHSSRAYFFLWFLV